MYVNSMQTIFFEFKVLFVLQSVCLSDCLLFQGVRSIEYNVFFVFHSEAVVRGQVSLFNLAIAVTDLSS